MLKLRCIVLWIIAVLLLPAANLAGAGESEYRAAWLEFAQPAINPADYPTAVHRHRARERAIAALGDPGKEAVALEALGYFYLRDFKYHDAQKAFEEAIRRNSQEPRLRYLLGTTRAILLVADPATMPEKCKDAIEEFKRAAKLDPDNAMPLIQAASIAFDSRRDDLALPLVAEALGRSAFRLYSMPVPRDLTGDPAQATAAWWWVQTGLWAEMTARGANCARKLVQRADRMILTAKTQQARATCGQGAEVAKKMYRGEPPLAMLLFAGLEAEKQAVCAPSYRTSDAMEETGDVVQRLDQIEAAQRQLQRLWQELADKERANPPATIEARLAHQKRLVEAVLADL